MKILQFGSTDVMGSRFNGQDLHKQFAKRGIDSQHIVWDKKGSDLNTVEITHSRFLCKLNALANKIQSALSLQSILNPSIFPLLVNRTFLNSDIVHYHLIHTGYFSLANFPLLTRMKPAVWTLHDPWAMTGHCVHPFDCQRWKTGCGSCPNLKAEFAMKRDNTALMWKLKKIFYANSKIDLIVASKWMLDMVNSSPLMSNFKVHHIPFGLDLNVFKSGPSAEKKKKLGIPPENVVISVRSTMSEYKGLEYIIKAIEILKTSVPITILTFNERGHFNQFLGKHQIIELGWVEDEEETIDAYQARDIFVMHSVAEAFGMMAMEAMACEKPVITFDGTSLSEVIFAPEGGISVPARDIDALVSAMCDLIENPEKRIKIGIRARELAVQHYDINQQIKRTLEVYQEVLSRRSLKDRIQVSNNALYPEGKK